ncbi:FAD:protein FMN transferase [Anoxynatronum sibiricum]|uniref:FAD:protein FMN transferase n=1 Tax=Anoxynatronum sibiricum TaxID=210623 RepID=A0ABU9VXM3_9CLOT
MKHLPTTRGIPVKMASLLLSASLLFAVLFFGCSTTDPGWSEKTETVLGTISHIRIHSEHRPEGDTAVASAFERVQEIEGRMSATLPDSQIYHINTAAGRTGVTVTDDVLFMIEEGLRYYQLTDGLFHIGLGTLTSLWGLSTDRPQVPEREAIQNTLAAIDIETIEISGSDVRIRQRGTAIDLGGIAKGYAVDEAARVLQDLGITSGFVNFGGDVYALGEKPDGTPWYVGIKEPIPGSTGLVGRLGVTNRSVVTSGDYERYLADENTGERFHHILDPRTGRPASNELVSVTIASDTALEGDILSTAVFVMGLEKGYRYVTDTPGADALFITRDDEVILTPGLRQDFELMNEAYILTAYEPPAASE